MSMLGDVWQRLRPQTLVGCDIGGDCCKYVVLLQRGVGLELVQHGMVGYPLRDDPDELIRVVKDTLQTQRVPLRSVGMNLVDKSLQVRTMELAKMPSRDLQMAIRWNMREAIEGPLEKYRVAYTRIATLEGDRQRMLTYGVSADGVQEASQRARALGLALRVLEPDPSALMAAMDHNLYWKPDERIALIHVGYRATQVLVAADGALHFVRVLNGASLERLGHILERTGDVEQQRAALHQIPQLLQDQPDRVGEALGKFYSELLLEIERALNAYMSESIVGREQGVSYLFLSGGGALLPNLSEYLAKNLGIGTELFNPFRKIVDGAGQPVLLPEAPLYAVAVGLAIPVK